MRIGRLIIEPEAMLLIALLYYLDHSGITLWVLLACGFHELGHYGMIRAMGGRIRRFSLSAKGAELQLSAAYPLSASEMTLAALAGPAVNLLLALGSTFLARRGLGRGLFLFAGVNLGLAGFNLLPIRWLDGGRALEGCFAWLQMERAGQWILSGFSYGTILLLLLFGGSVFLQSGGKSFTLLLAGGWMFLVAWREKRQL